MTLNLELDPQTAEALERLAAARGTTPAALAQEALATLLKEHEPQQEPDRPRRLPGGTGKFRSGHTDTAKRAEEILREAAEKGRWP